MLRYVSVFFLICLIGCTTVKTWKRVDKLEPATDAYGRAMRWGNYKEATAFIKDTAPGVSFEAFSRIKVTSYKVVNREISPDQFQAAQAVEIQYFYKDKLKQKTIMDRQLWQYDEEDAAWYLSSGLPPFE